MDAAKRSRFPDRLAETDVCLVSQPPRGLARSANAVRSLHAALDRKLACANRLMPRMRPPCPRPPNGSDAHLRGQGPRGYGSAAHGLPACESRDAGRAPP
jgi:hypothetical protein